MESIRALLFDTRSIQRYIFSGSRLKTQIGASYLIAQVFQKFLVEETLCKDVFSPSDVEDLSDANALASGQSIDWSKMETKCRVAYIGGGNALVLLRGDVTEETAKRIVTSFTTHLLAHCPGLHTGVAFAEHIDFSSPVSFRETFDALYKKLKQNQNTVFPAVHMPYTGLTHACSLNGETADFFDANHILARDGSSQRFFSQEMAAKAVAAQGADQHLHKILSHFLAVMDERDGTERHLKFDEFAFPMELDLMGQRNGGTTANDPCNDIAIVHIDGNNMGKKFQQCEDLSARRALSLALLRRSQAAFAELVAGIMDEYETYTFLSLEHSPKKYLPLRPIILGGDDITFVCAAQVALRYTTRLMKLLAAPDEKEPAGLKKGMDCCGGIAILPTSYPFFRGYELAEQLCGAAKAEMRKRLAADGTGSSSWIDFAILHGEQPPELIQLREQEYRGLRGTLHFGPYRVDAGEGDVQNAVHLVRAAHALHKLPSNKVKELREILTRDEHTTRQFLTQMAHLDIDFPVVAGWEAYGKDEALWHENRTPYVDAIEMMDYIPKEFDEEEDMR
ncbi:Cas10/Cmr2 second palm domain-containing protein [Selenomonas artemidis]|uniref:Cas10/Cmr2 second palm domain-containing protein n=1 Tax=Selenomonas artemidis TaxID=671224 RepID=UPI0003FC5674|nr:hypothetical protein [Selenomonas artemidis]